MGSPMNIPAPIDTIQKTVNNQLPKQNLMIKTQPQQP